MSDSLQLHELFALVFCLVVLKTDVAKELINVSTTGHILGCVVSYNIKPQLQTLAKVWMGRRTALIPRYTNSYFLKATKKDRIF